MGDRCWMRVEFRKADEARVVEALGEFEDVTEDGGVVTGEGNGYNYGACSELEEMARWGVPFVAHNGAGGDYGDGYTAACGGALACMGADSESWPTVRFDPETGEACPDSLKRAREYAAVERRARAALEQPPAGGEVPGEQVERVSRKVEKSFANRQAYTVAELFHAGCLGGRALIGRPDAGEWRCYGCHGVLAGETADAMLVEMALRGEA